MLAQATLLGIGSSDKTSFFLTGTTYSLLKNPDKLERLQKETFAHSNESDSSSLLEPKYLGAVLEEGLWPLPNIQLGLIQVSLDAIVDGHYTKR